MQSLQSPFKADLSGLRARGANQKFSFHHQISPLSDHSCFACRAHSSFLSSTKNPSLRKASKQAFQVPFIAPDKSQNNAQFESWRFSATMGPGSDTAPASTPAPASGETSGIRGLDDSPGIARTTSIRVPGKEVSRRVGRGRLRSTAVDRGETTGAPGSFETRVERGVEDRIRVSGNEVSRRVRRGRLRSTAVDRGETTGAPGSVETRVERGVEDGTGYDSDVEVGDVNLPHEQPWGGIHPAVQFVTEFLREELPKFFAEEGFSSAVYRKDVHFKDPLISVRGVQLFDANVFLLRLLFAGGQFVLHDIRPRGRYEVAARWTFVLPTRFLPWQPPIAFTGVSTFGVDRQQAKLTSHYDYWDNLTDKENEPPSLAAIAYVASQIQPLTAFNRLLDRPFLLLRRAKDYDIRRYDVEDEALGATVIAVRRGEADLIAALNRDRIQLDRTECSVRIVRTSWPHKELREVYVPVTYVPRIDDSAPVDYEGVDWKED